ncbi:MAG TPA: WYL domain-containing transcriptional regulator [Polyangia bacterium]|jgi:proteasome accessory factor B
MKTTNAAKVRPGQGKRRRTGANGPYAPAVRLQSVRALLDGGAGATIYDIAERFGVSVRTALRYLEAVRAGGEPLYEEIVDRKKLWRLMPAGRRETVTLTTSQMLSLFLSRRVFDFLTGTGFKEDLDDVFARLEATLRRRDFVAARNLDRKIFDVNEAPHIYEGRLEHVNEILTALLREERLDIRHQSIGAGKRAVLFEPFTLLVYKKGLYLAGFSHAHGQIRTLALDGFREVSWRRGDGFPYPADFHPAEIAEGAFGLIKGAPATVRVFFTERVARYVTRRLWHRTQKFRRARGGVVMTIEVNGTVELASWVLSFGDQAEVLAPRELRDSVAGELTRAAARYAPGARRVGL